jgi:hypothetical protein
LNTDRFNRAFRTIGSFLAAHDELPASTILIADNNGHFLRGVVTDWNYYTYGTHKGIELYVFNPEDGNQFLTVEIWLPKEQQRNIEKKESYASSFQQILSFMTSSLKYRLDLVFQDDVRLEWGKGYNFKLDDEGISLSFVVNTAAHPKVKMKEYRDFDDNTKSSKEKQAVTPSVTPSVTPTVVLSAASATPTATHKKKKKSSVSATPTITADSGASSTDDSR